jgi:hypothetical protein
VYLEEQDTYVPDDKVPQGARVLNISGTELRDRLNEAARSPPGSPIRRLSGSCAAAILPGTSRA